MAFEEEAAYALAAWQRFDGAIGNELTRAITGAFALVATADGDFSEAELSRFMQLLRERSGVLAPLDFEDVEHAFEDIVGALLSDPATGRRRALDRVAAVRANTDHCELVRAAAEIAVAADNRRLEQEQVVLGEICSAMGLKVR